MAIKAATPYIFVPGRAPQAIEHYGAALGAEVSAMMRFGDIDPSAPEEKRDLIMHCELMVGGAKLMLSNGMGDETTKREDPAVHIALSLDDEADARRKFDALAQGGTVTEALFSSPWGTLFGSLTDRFGVSWLFDVELDQR